MELTGCGTALVTPFCADLSLDETALVDLVERQVQAGVTLLVPCGTTGEASTLTEDEWFRVIELTCQTADGRVAVLAGCTHQATAAAVARARRLEGMAGLTGILSANPYYNRPSQEGQFQHFKAIAEATALPLMLYNIPHRTGANLEPETVLRLAELENVIGIKESSGNLVQITELMIGVQTTAPEGFHVFAGDDALALPVLALGASGLISVASNVIPEPMVEMVKAAIEGDWRMARRINRQFFRLMQANFTEPSPAPVKALMAICGMGEDVLRLPMLKVTKGVRLKLEQMSGELGLLVSQPPTGEDLRMF